MFRAGNLYDARKRRLIAAALARKTLRHAPEDVYRHAVDGAELYADGLLTRGEAETLWTAAYCHRVDHDGSASRRFAQLLCGDVLNVEADYRSTNRDHWFYLAGVPLKEQADAVRCAVQCPHHYGFGTYADLPWITAEAWRMAEALYWDRDPVGMLALADLLEESGATELVHVLRVVEPFRCEHCLGFFELGECPEHGDVKSYRYAVSERHANQMVAHLRSGCAHIKGCWALDVLTGRSCL